VADCPTDEPCALLTWHLQHEVGLLFAIHQSLEGDHAGAGTLLRDLVRIDQALVRGAPNLLASVVGLTDLSAALDKASLIQHRLSAEPAGPARDAALIEIVATAEAVTVQPSDIQPALVNDYLIQRAAIDTLTHDAGLLFDAAATARVLDARFERRASRAAAGDLPGALGAGEVSQKDQFGWWFDNAGGKLVLDTLSWNPQTVREGLEANFEAIDDRRARILAH